MHLSTAFEFGLMLAIYLYFDMWAHLIMGAICRITILDIHVSCGYQLKRLYTVNIKGVELIMGYWPYQATVRFLGFDRKSYDKLDAAARPHAFLFQSQIKQLAIKSIPGIIAILAIGAGIHFFNAEQSFGGNLVSIADYLKSIFIYSLTSRCAISAANIASLPATSLLALCLVLYGLFWILFLLLGALRQWVSQLPYGFFRWLGSIGFIILFLFCWVKIPLSVFSLLTLSWIQIISGAFQMLAAIYVVSAITWVSVYLFLHFSPGLNYQQER